MKGYLSQQGIPFQVRLLTDPANRREMERHGPGAAPLTVIGGQAVFGFQRPALLAALRRAGLAADSAQSVERPWRPGRLEARAPLAEALAVTSFLGDGVTLLHAGAGDYLGPDLEGSTIAVRGHPIAVAACPAFGTAAVVSYEAGTVTFLSLKDGGYVHGDLASSTVETGELPLYAVAHPTEPLLYVSNSGAGSVTIFDPRTGACALGSLERSRFAVSGQPGVMAVHGKTNRLYVRLREGAVTILDAWTLRPVGCGTFATGKGRGIALSADGDVLYVTEALGEAEGLALYDARTGLPLFGSRERSLLPTAPTPFAVAAHPVKPLVYVSCFGARVVELRDGRTGRYLTGEAASSSVPVGSGARALLVDPRDDVLYVSCFDEDSVLMFNALDGAPRFGDPDRNVRRTGRGPRGMALLGPRPQRSP